MSATCQACGAPGQVGACSYCKGFVGELAAAREETEAERWAAAEAMARGKLCNTFSRERKVWAPGIGDIVTYFGKRIAE